MIKQERMYVFPQFKKIIKQEALEQGKTVIEWTREFTQEQDPIHKLAENIQKKKKGGGGFDFV